MSADRPATHTTNGVDVERLVATINAVQENPDLARFRFQAQTEWLTSCLTVGFAYNAAARGIAVENLEFSIDGDLDLRPFLGISQEGRPASQRPSRLCGLRTKYTIEADPGPSATTCGHRLHLAPWRSAP